jgi:hypothetical protein
VVTRAEPNFSARGSFSEEDSSRLSTPRWSKDDGDTYNKSVVGGVIATPNNRKSGRAARA